MTKTWGRPAAGGRLAIGLFGFLAIAPAQSQFEVEGIRLGMPVKEAMTALRAHNANMRLAPESFTYEGLPSALTYAIDAVGERSEEHTSELQSRLHLVCRLLLEKKK